MRNEEGALRDALHARAAAVPVGRPDETGLGRRLAVARRRRQARLAAAAAALVVVIGAGSLVAATGEGESNVVTGPDPSSTTTMLEPATVETTTVETTTVEPTTTLPVLVPEPTTPTTAGDTPGGPPQPAPTLGAPRATTTIAPVPPVPDDAVWPPPGSSTVFPTADRAADDFTRRFLRMATPQLGAAQVRGDTATVAVRPLPASTLTTVVSLRRVDRRGWVVVGSAAQNIQVDQPAAGATVSSPLVVRGSAWTFEGNVTVEVRRDGATTPIGTSFGTGGGDQMRPFDATVTFARPSVARGTVVASEGRADDETQGPAAATVVRVRF